MTDNTKRIGEKITFSITGESYQSYVPKPLPPSPPIQIEKLFPILDQANIAMGRLDGLSLLLPDTSLFLYMYIRKEAVLSSQIEGTQSTLSDLLSYENHAIAGGLNQDVVEVSNYVAAMEHGLKRIQDGFPLSLRLIREMHGILLSDSRGSTKLPGEFRKSQNWIGGTRPGNAKFVPPPVDEMKAALNALELFLHDETVQLPTLVKAALAHHQFETIHPFLDGNGRLGRLLITFILCSDGTLREPLLYLSLYFKKHRQSYYDHLQLVRETGDWEEWIRFFLKGVTETANEAFETATLSIKLFESDRKKIETEGATSLSSLSVHHFLQKHPLTDAKTIVKKCAITPPTAYKALAHLVDLGIVNEVTGKTRNKIYVYQGYLNILNNGA